MEMLTINIQPIQKKSMCDEYRCSYLKGSDENILMFFSFAMTATHSKCFKISYNNEQGQTLYCMHSTEKSKENLKGPTSQRG